MQYSTNYNLNLIEGTDIVNPLVIDKPNYVTIDSQMKSNEDATVGTASEIKTGTVHALTRNNTNNNAFRYVATSVCNSGDTFTVDGVAVTALLPSGEALGNNAYTIGCNVFAILTSTELTIFTNGGTAQNSEMLNGQLPAHYLNAYYESFDNTGSNLTSISTEGAIKEVNTKTAKTLYMGSLGGTTAKDFFMNVLDYIQANAESTKVGAFTCDWSGHDFTFGHYYLTGTNTAYMVAYYGGQHIYRGRKFGSTYEVSVISDSPL